MTVMIQTPCATAQPHSHARTGLTVGTRRHAATDVRAAATTGSTYAYMAVVTPTCTHRAAPASAIVIPRPAKSRPGVATVVIQGGPAAIRIAPIGPASASYALRTMRLKTPRGVAGCSAKMSTADRYGPNVAAIAAKASVPATASSGRHRAERRFARSDIQSAVKVSRVTTPGR